MRYIAMLAAAALIAGCGQSTSNTDVVSDAEPRLESGIDRDGMDRNIRPQDDFFAYANGAWVDTTDIPADQSGWGSFLILRDNGLAQLRTIVEDAADGAWDERGRKIADYYASYIDEARVDSLGLSPIADLLAEVDALDDHAGVVAFMADHNELGIGGPLGLFVGQDRKSPDEYIVTVTQSGLGLPDRDYYFDDSERGMQLRNGYADYVSDMLELSGYADATGAADRIMALETQLAEHQWTRVENRQAEKTYNKVSSEEFATTLSNIDTARLFEGIGIGAQEHLIIRQPSYVEALNGVFMAISIETWREYLRLQVVDSFASFLSTDFVDRRFEFYGEMLQGREAQQDRWKRAINSLNGNLGELVGQIYVQRHFPPEAKRRMDELVANLILAYEESITNLEWMSEETRAKALDKLANFTPMIGYPEKWRDYSDLEISADDLIGNIRNARVFEHYRQVDKLGTPVDRAEWFMSPQTVNAYYSPARNQIVFPAAILQPPFFDLNADDARNYGGIGMVIGHEIGHGFDDQGSKYDGGGNLRNWWTDDDRERFEERTGKLVDQFNGYEALPGLHVNGELTLGENIGDLGGAGIALRAYELSLDGEEAPIIDGMTGTERFFLGLAQVWRSKYRDEAIELRVKSDPHSPPYFRVNGVVPNIDAFYETFDVQEGDAHYLPSEERVRIWR